MRIFGIEITQRVLWKTGQFSLGTLCGIYGLAAFRPGFLGAAILLFIMGGLDIPYGLIFKIMKEGFQRKFGRR